MVCPAPNGTSLCESLSLPGSSFNARVSESPKFTPRFGLALRISIPSELFTQHLPRPSAERPWSHNLSAGKKTFGWRSTSWESLPNGSNGQGKSSGDGCACMRTSRVMTGQWPLRRPPSLHPGFSSQRSTTPLSRSHHKSRRWLRRPKDRKGPMLFSRRSMQTSKA